MLTQEERRHSLILLVCSTLPTVVYVAHLIAYRSDHLVLSAFLFCVFVVTGLLCFRTARRLGTQNSAFSMMVITSLLLGGSLLWMSPIGRGWLAFEPAVRFFMAAVMSLCSGAALVLLILQRSRD